MNTEINFLEKQQQKIIAPFILGFIFVFLMIFAVGVAYIQKSHYTDKIDSVNERLVHNENALKKYDSHIAEHQQMKHNIFAIQSSVIPNVALYQYLLALLPNENQLIHYQQIEKNQAVIVAEFTGMQFAADYVSKILEQNFTLDTQLTNVSKTESGYQATLTIVFDKDKLVEELGNND
ncbi:hypothetical protein [Virgibacillus ndiopensis]|uniref:hypothetical protein n=1 Tax=Virgibacillus ndiopensis TaxID=2004408 RepID=UPI000C069F93|nr:hypothetical protein [Virgibacillus ndiopensis]